MFYDFLSNNLGPGSPPNSIVVLAQPNQEINVEWAPPDLPNGKIVEYIIHYGPISEGITCSYIETKKEYQTKKNQPNGQRRQ